MERKQIYLHRQSTTSIGAAAPHGRGNSSAESYQKYLVAATSLYEEDRDAYLRKAIEASYKLVAKTHGLARGMKVTYFSLEFHIEQMYNVCINQKEVK